MSAIWGDEGNPAGNERTAFQLKRKRDGVLLQGHRHFSHNRRNRERSREPPPAFLPPFQVKFDQTFP